MVDKDVALRVISDGVLNGKSLADIGVELGCTREYVRQLANSFGIERKKKDGSIGRVKERLKLVNRDTRCFEMYGCSFSEVVAIRDASVRMNGVDAASKYSMQKRHSKLRDVPFNISLVDWWGYWNPYWEKRGTKKGQMVMCRTSDAGGYAVGNVRIDYATANGHEKKMSNAIRRGCQWSRPGYTYPGLRSRILEAASKDD